MYTREDFSIYLIQESINIFFCRRKKKEKELKTVREFLFIKENFLRPRVEKSSWTKNARYFTSYFYSIA